MAQKDIISKQSIKRIAKAGKMITQMAVEKSGIYQLGEERGEEREQILAVQNSIISILSTRFTQIPELIKTKLLEIKNIEILNQLLIKAISVSKTENIFDE